MFETTNQFFNVQHHFQGDTTKNGASRADGINSVQSGHFSSSCWGKAWIKTNLQRTRRLLPQVLLKMTYKKKNVFLGKSKVPRVMHQISTLDHRA